MTSHPLLLTAYLITVLVALACPYLWAATPPRTAAGPARLTIDLFASLSLAGLWVTVTRTDHVLPWAALLVLPFVRQGRMALWGAGVALLLFAPALWWRDPPQLNASRTVILVVLGLACAFLQNWRGGAARTDNSIRFWTTLLALLVIGLGMGLWTGPLNATQSGRMAWHHWGAYLAPVEALLAGGVPYRDFPLQYGSGPTLLLAAVCGKDCWSGLYLLALLINAVYFVTLGAAVLLLTRARGAGFRLAAMIAMFCATFLWTAYPVDMGSTVVTPSVSAMRFLPLAWMLLYILQFEAGGRRADWIGHLLFALAIFWSPETAIFALLLWWPYLALRRAETLGGSARFTASLSRDIVCCIGAFASCVLLFALGYRLAFGGWLHLEDFLLYFRYPPGAIGMNPRGPLWLALAVVVLAVITIRRSHVTAETRPAYACLLTFLAAGIYYLSRSHDSNVLNLFPFMLLVTLATLNAAEGGDPRIRAFISGFVGLLLAVLVAYVASFSHHSIKRAARNGELASFGASRLVARFSPSPTDPVLLVDRPAAIALTHLRGLRQGPVVLFDDSMVMPWAAAGQAWTPVNNLANFFPLPLPIIEHFVVRGARTYRRAGWLLVDHRKYMKWARLFAAAYDTDRTLNFGDYTAYHLVPGACRTGVTGRTLPANRTCGLTPSRIQRSE